MSHCRKLLRGASFIVQILQVMEEPEVVEEAPAAEVSESLVGLMGAFDKLKEAVGYGGENNEFNEIERFVQDIEQENAKLRQHAEDAIVVSGAALNESC